MEIMKLAAIAIGFLATVVLPSSPAPVQNSTDKLEGKTAPAFSMKTTDGKTLNNANLKGKVVLLDFWATWCGPCKAASPTMQKLHKQYAAKGLVVVGVDVMEDGNAKQLASAYKAEHKYTYTFTYDNDALANKWGVKGIPQFVLIDRKGVVKETWFGWGDTNKADMVAKVGKAVATQ